MDLEFHTLNDYIDVLTSSNILVSVSGSSEKQVTNISYDSREVGPGGLFICKGQNFDPGFLNSAIENGAIAYVSENDYHIDGVTGIIVSDIRLSMALITKTYFGDISSAISLIGITGTKGKSTTVFYLKSILDNYLMDYGMTLSGVSSGIYNFDGKSRFDSALTTPEPIELYNNISRAIDNGSEYFLMEVSSQALKYHRVTGLNFEVAAFLNIGEDHLSPSEHPDMDDYINSKLRIFQNAKFSIYNLDTPYTEQIQSAIQNTSKSVTYSLETKVANVYGYNIEQSGLNTRFDVRVSQLGDYQTCDFACEIPSIGNMNVSNALASISIAVAIGIPSEYIVKGLGTVKVPGRMEIIESNGQIVVVDYAHNQMSFEALLSSISQIYPDKSINIVFGAVGGKALNRREGMAKAAAKYCKHIYLTEDDPYNENLNAICHELAAPIARAHVTYDIIPSRPKAIARAIQEADTDTIVVVAGKGIETRQHRKGENAMIPSDALSVKEALYQKSLIREYNSLVKPIKEYVDALHSAGLFLTGECNPEKRILGITSIPSEAKRGYIFVAKDSESISDDIVNAMKHNALAFISDRLIDSVPSSFSHIIVSDLDAALQIILDIFYGKNLEDTTHISVLSAGQDSICSYLLANTCDALYKSLDENFTVMVDAKNKWPLNTSDNPFVLYDWNILENVINQSKNDNLRVIIDENINDKFYPTINLLCLCESAGESADSIIKRIKKSKNTVLNLDDVVLAEVKSKLPARIHPITFSKIRKDGDLYFSNISFQDGLLQFDCEVLCGKYAGFSSHIATQNLALDDLDEILTAISAAFALSFPPDFIINSIEQIRIPGKTICLNSSNSNKSVKLISGDSYDRVFDEIIKSNREQENRTIICVLNNRNIKDTNTKDLYKVLDAVDYTIITEPIKEANDSKISSIMDVLKDDKYQQNEYEIILERKLAINSAIGLVPDNSTILVQGSISDEKLIKKALSI